MWFGGEYKIENGLRTRTSHGGAWNKVCAPLREMQKGEINDERQGNDPRML